MTPAEEKRVHELTEEIAGLKKHLVLKSAVMTNRDSPALTAQPKMQM